MRHEIPFSQYSSGGTKESQCDIRNSKYQERKDELETFYDVRKTRR